MENTRQTFVALLALTLGFSVIAVSPAYACGDGSCEPPPPPEETTNGNNGFGQEMQGNPQDGTNPGSFQGGGVPAGGPGAGMAGDVSKLNGTGLR